MNSFYIFACKCLLKINGKNFYFTFEGVMQNAIKIEIQKKKMCSFKEGFVEKEAFLTTNK